MNLEELHQMGQELESWLRMRVHPVAIKLLKNREETPKRAIIPTRDWKHKYSLCQTIARSQSYGETIAMFKEDHWCFEPVVGLGLVEFPESFKNGSHRYPDSSKTLEAAAKWGANMPRLPFGDFTGIVTAPVNNCNFIPDILVMHINGLEATMLAIIKNYIDGKDIYSQLSGHAACVYTIVPSILSNECNFSLPCKGDRHIAFAQDSEILFSMPIDQLPDFIEGIHYEQAHEWGLPLLPFMKEEYPLKPKYKAEGEKMGLDLRQSPPRPQEYEKY
jgi:uncharacterized protein (DUF169 family)